MRLSCTALLCLGAAALGCAPEPPSPKPKRPIVRARDVTGLPFDTFVTDPASPPAAVPVADPALRIPMPSCVSDLQEGCALRFEAEQLQGEWRTQANLGGFSGEGFIVSNASGVASSSMTGSLWVEAGTYGVWTRGFVDGFDRAWTLEVGGQRLAPVHGRSATRYGFHWEYAGEVELEEGELDIALIDLEPGFEVADAIVLSTDLDYDPIEDERSWRVLDPQIAGSMVFNEIMQRTRRYEDRWASVSSIDKWSTRADGLHEQLRRSIGLRADEPRPPLEVELSKTIERDGYRIELLSFNSRAGTIVPANVYVPDGVGPFPVVLSPIGHHMIPGKAHPEVSARAQGLARLGYLVLTYDPFGQRERRGTGNSHQEHWRLLLSGRSNLAIMVWDTIRALDYLETRPDADLSRVGLTGSSGGGLNTLYTAIAEPRVGAAAPANYVSQWVQIFQRGGAHDPCTYVPGVARFTTMGEMLGLFAPRPMLVLNAAFDPEFTTEGARRAVERGRDRYDLYFASEQLAFETVPGGHQYGPQMRAQMYGFFEQHLSGRGKGRRIFESPSDPFEFDALDVFASGSVPERSETTFETARRWAEERVAALPSPETFDVAQRRAQLRSLVHPSSNERATPISFEIDDLHHAPDVEIEKWRVHTDPGIELPVHVAVGRPDKPIVVIADDAFLPRRDLMSAFSQLGMTAVYFSPRGHGETRGNETFIASTNILLGDPIQGQRAWDIARVADAIRSDERFSGRAIGLLAVGARVGLDGLFAQSMFSAFDVIAINSIASSYFKAFDNELHHAGYVHDILSVADVPQLVAMASERPAYVAFSDELYRERYPSWAAELDRKGIVSTSPDIHLSIVFVRESLDPS